MSCVYFLHSTAQHSRKNERERESKWSVVKYLRIRADGLVLDYSTDKRSFTAASLGLDHGNIATGQDWTSAEAC